tara:strand:- start:141 stop:371 length:231 start_codon:yes stop_codon:yes gene_type:complete
MHTVFGRFVCVSVIIYLSVKRFGCKEKMVPEWIHTAIHCILFLFLSQIGKGFGGSIFVWYNYLVCATFKKEKKEEK